MIRFVFVYLVTTGFLASCVSNPDHANNKEGASESIDELYQQFSTAYKTFDADLVSSLYTSDANYLPNNPNQPVLESREAIHQSFASYFKYVESNDQDLTISFRIINRRIDDSLAYDTGYYLIQTKPMDADFSDEGSVGKFVTVMGLQQDGSWKFLLDGYNPAPYEAFFADSSAHNPQKEF